MSRKQWLIASVLSACLLMLSALSLVRAQENNVTPSDSRGPLVFAQPETQNSLGFTNPVTNTYPYSITEFASLSGNTTTIFGINDAGEIVGSSVASDFQRHAVLWLPQAAHSLPAGLNDLGTLGGWPTDGEGINNSGQVVGTTKNADGKIRAFLWQNGVMSDLGTLGGNHSWASSINENGQVSGNAELSFNNPHAFIWSQGGGMVDLGTLDGISTASDVNDLGQAVGWYWTTGDPPKARAFLWNGSNMFDLGTLGGAWSEANAINNNGEVVGQAELPNGEAHPFLWLPAPAYGFPAGMNDLDTFGGPDGSAIYISDDGIILGTAELANGDNHAFIWENGNLTDLNNQIDPNLGWELVAALDMNTSGVIIGNGYINGGIFKGFILTPNCGGISLHLSPAFDCPATDLVPEKIEVTQGIQDLNNSVRLVTDKRTFVRVHVKAFGGDTPATARLKVVQGPNQIWLQPLNPQGQINVPTIPVRTLLDDAFLFELPNEYRQGQISLTFEIDPDNLVEEYNEDNNTLGPIQVTFEDVPPLNLAVYRFSYTVGNTTYTTANTDVDKLSSWLKRVYPLNVLNLQRFQDYWGVATVVGGNLANPTCAQINTYLASIRAAMLAMGGISPDTHYYGMVDDVGGFMRGCANTIPALVASGPTGDPATLGHGWDADGAYGDWYGAHELAHAYGRYHAEFCGAAAGQPYPYPRGEISPDVSPVTNIFGFDIESRNIYGRVWHDMMTYCTFQWISDFTYEGLMDTLQTAPVLAPLSGGTADRLLVSGMIDPATGETTLQPLLVLPEALEIAPPGVGEYAIVLRNASGGELARYPFTPGEIHSGPPLNPGDAEIYLLTINELVPYFPDTAQVDIEGPNGILTTIIPGPSTPTVTLTFPNGGETLPDDFTVTWTASDPDADPLSYTVQYTPDDGLTWLTLAMNLTDTHLDLQMGNVVSSSTARIRVLATDGIHTAHDESDAPFTVPNRLPEVQIIEPEDSFTLTVSQTLGLAGTAYDIDRPLPLSQLTWTSNLDGLLGNGEQLSVSGLSVGAHTLTFQADDDNGGIVTDTVTVTVVADLTELPPIPDALVAGPTLISLHPGVISDTIRVQNQNFSNPLDWAVSSDQPWVQLSGETGTTPEYLTVSVDLSALLPGIHTAALTFTSPDLPGESVSVFVEVNVSENYIFLPLIVR